MKRRTQRVAKGHVEPEPCTTASFPHEPADGGGSALDRYRNTLDAISREAAAYIDRFYNSPAPCAILDRHHRIRDCNRSLARLLGTFPSRLRDAALVDHIEKPFQEPLLSILRDAWHNVAESRCAIALLRENGPSLRARISARVSGGHPSSIGPECRVVISDVVDNDARREPSRDDQSVDPLTGALSRPAGFLALEYSIAECHKERKPLMIALFVLDNLRYINDHFGYFEGDETIATTAATIRRITKKSDLLFRLDGACFLLILRRCNAELAELVIDRIAAELEKRNKESGKPFPISWRFGIEEWHEENDATIDDLVRRVEQKTRRQESAFDQVETPEAS